MRDEESVSANGLCEIKIIDNQILNSNNRSDFLDELLEAVNGIEYYINNFNSIGILYYDVGDYYDIQIGDTIYNCLMLNDEINVTQGIQEIVYTDMPPETKTDYSKADKTDRRINEAYIIMDKQKQRLDSVISQVGDRETKTTSLTQDVDSLSETVEQIGDISSQFEQFKVDINGAVNTLIENGGNNIFYYDTDFWTGEDIEVPVYYSIEVGDNLSGKKLAFSFPDGVYLSEEGSIDLLKGATGYSITTDTLFDVETTHWMQDIIVKQNGTDIRIYRYDMTAHEIIQNDTEIILSNNFGNVTLITSLVDVIQYINVEETEIDNVINLQEYYDTEFKTNSVSGIGYIVNQGMSKQDTTTTKMSIQNGKYTISFKYKKLNVALAVTKVKINGEEIVLDKYTWTDFSKTIDVNSNYIEIQFLSNVDGALYVADLMCNIGEEASIWTQNPNETRTDTVKIGKGIEITASNTDTKLKADADGVRIVQASNDKNVVAEFTDKGTETKEIIVKGEAQITGLLFQKVGNQVWISSLL